jgi:hypothetical protein
MKTRRSGVATAAILTLAAVPATLGVAQAQTQPPFERQGGPSPEVRARLHDGRMAMIREALRLDEAQLKLWAPVEAQLRAAFAARQRARAEWRQGPPPRDVDSGSPSLAERLDRRSRRMAERAERAKALAEAFRPFYASLSDQQKAVARVVLTPAVDGPRPDRRRFMRRASRADDR